MENGTRIGSYEILSALGSGGMGEVYRAGAVLSGRDAALAYSLWNFPVL